MRKQTIAAGAVLLLVANLFVKVIGVGLKLPLHRLLADEGMGYFNAAYNLYTWFFMLSTTGLPIAVSALVAERRARGEPVGGLMRTALRVLCLLGVGGSVLMWVLARPFAAASGIPGASYSVFALAPALAFTALSGGLRGYFQGEGNMLPTALSQVTEAVGKLVLGISFAVFATRAGKPTAVVSAYAILGVTVGCVLSLCLLLGWYIVARRREPESGGIAETRSGLFLLIRAALPVTISASVFSFTAVLDTALLPARLQSAAGYSAAAAVALYGNYTTLVLPVFHLPTVLFSPICSAVLPALAAARANPRKTTELQNGTLRAVSLLSVPSALGLSVFAFPILSFLFPVSSATLAAPALAALAVGVVFYGMVSVTNTCLQAAGTPWRLLVGVVFGVAGKFAVTYLLAGDARTAVYAAPLGTVACYLLISLVNLCFLEIRGAHVVSLAAALPAVFAGGVLYGTLQQNVLPALVALGVSVTVVAVLYFGLLLLAGGIDVGELAALPVFSFFLRCFSRARVQQKGTKYEPTSSKSCCQNPIRHGGFTRHYGNPARTGRLSVGRGTDAQEHSSKFH